jgi:glycosyltransferase involved in cell wall biosynthesis
MTMRILLLSFYYQPDLCAGSFRATAMVQALLKQLPADTHLEIVSTAPNRYVSYSETVTNGAHAVEQHDQYTIHRIALPTHESGMLDQSKSFFVFAKEALKLTKQQQYQLVVATSSRLMTASLAAYIASQKRAPLYLDIRDIFVDTIKDVISAKSLMWLAPALSWVEKKTINTASKVNLVSEGFLPYFKKRYPTQRYSCFTNGIDQEFIDASEASLAQTQHSPDTEVNILYAGNIGEGQGLSHIVPLLAKALQGRARFTVIGDGGRYKQLKLALEQQRCTNVELVPPMNRARLIEAYLKADILFLHLNAFPAFEKVLPSKIFEYAVLGKPILAGVAGYPAWFIQNEVDNARVFEPCNVAEAVLAFERLDLQHHSRAEFLKKFNRSNIMDAMAEDILSLLPNVVSSPLMLATGKP